MAKSSFDNLWDKSKDGSKGERRSFLRFVIIATAVFVVILLLKKDSVINWARSGIELQRQKREMEYYRREIKKLDLQIEGLSANRDSMETYAREQFHFAKPGDDVYVIEK